MPEFVERSVAADALRGRRRTPTSTQAGLVALTIGCLACDARVTEPVPARVVAVDIATVPAPLVRRLTLHLDQRQGARVEYWSAGGPRLRVTSGDEQTNHELTLARLPAGSTYQYEVCASGPLRDGERVSAHYDCRMETRSRVRCRSGRTGIVRTGRGDGSRSGRCGPVSSGDQWTDGERGFCLVPRESGTEHRGRAGRRMTRPSTNYGRPDGPENSYIDNTL